MTTWGELDRSVHKTWAVLASCTKVTDVLAKRAFGVLIYLRKAALCHLPSVWIMESSVHTRAAVGSCSYPEAMSRVLVCLETYL